MRVSTIDMQQRVINSMLNNQQRVRESLEQISSGKRLLKPSYDPLASARSNILNSNVKALESYQKNGKIADSKLALVENTFSSVSNNLLRTDELQKQALNDTLSYSDRLVIAEELEANLNTLIGLATSRDMDGNFGFSGFKSDTPAYVKSTTGADFQGDAGQRMLQVGSSSYVPLSYSGDDVFEDVLNGNGKFVTSNGLINNTGTGVISLGSVIDIAAYVEDDYSLRFVTNGSGELAYEVISASSGQVIPAIPATSPTDAPAFNSGDSIVFNGMEVNISGEPAVGDDFAIKPSNRQNIFTTMQNMIDNLRQPINTPADKAKFINAMDRNSGSLQQGLNKVLLTITRIGADSKTIEDQQTVNDDLLIHNRLTLASLNNIDPAEAISRLTMEMNGLQTAQLSFSKIQQLSLFNYI